MIVDYKPTTVMSHYVYRLLTTLMTSNELILTVRWGVWWGIQSYQPGGARA